MGAKMSGVHTLPQRYHLFLKPEDQCQILKPETENSMVLATEEGVKKAGLNPLLSSLGNTTERWGGGGEPIYKVYPSLTFRCGGRKGGRGNETQLQSASFSYCLRCRCTSCCGTLCSILHIFMFSFSKHLYLSSPLTVCWY